MRLSVFLIHSLLPFCGAELQRRNENCQDQREGIHSEAQKSKSTESLSSSHRNTGAEKSYNIGGK